MSNRIQTLSATISKLFRLQRQKRADVAQRRQYINQIVENIIDDIDPRLRCIMGYKKALSPCVEQVLSYAEQVCSLLPGPMLFTKETHRTNATVRTLFSDFRTMAEVFSQCEQVQDFFNNNPSADRAYLVLGMRMKESQAFGMQQQGDIIIKDVLQTNVNFDDYRITHPSRDEESLRYNLRERALHECVAQTIKKLIETKSFNSKLEEDEIKLKMQLSIIKNQKKGLDSIIHDNYMQLDRIQEIETKLKEIENTHSEVSKDVGTLDATLKKAASILIQPSELIEVSRLSFCVDRFNQIIKDNAENEEFRVNLAQITFSENEKRVGILAVFPRNELILLPIKPVFL